MTSSILQPFVGRFADRHPQAVFAIDRDGFHLLGCIMLSVGQQLFTYPCCRGCDRMRLVDIPSRGIAHRTDGCGGKKDWPNPFSR